MNALKKLLPTRVIEGLRYIRHGRLSWDRSIPSSNLSSAMTTAEERALFTKSVKNVLHLQGAIVDLGCWLGSTTISMAQGLRESGDSGKIHSFDLFRWDPWMDDYSTEHWCDYRPGESFLPETRRRVGDLLPWVNLIEADLSKYHWEGGPIRLQLVDAMKTWELGTSICREFYPSMVEGGLVLQQDYLAFSIPWIPIIHYRLRDYMQLEAVVSHGATVSFKVVKKIPPEAAVHAGDFSGLTDEEAEAAFTWSLNQIGDRARAGTACHRIMYYLDKDNLDKAKEILRISEAEHVEPRGIAPAKKALLNRIGAK